jgi:hypothetical protein
MQPLFAQRFRNYEHAYKEDLQRIRLTEAAKVTEQTAVAKRQEQV